MKLAKTEESRQSLRPALKPTKNLHLTMDRSRLKGQQGEEAPTPIRSRYPVDREETSTDVRGPKDEDSCPDTDEEASAQLPTWKDKAGETVPGVWMGDKDASTEEVQKVSGAAKDPSSLELDDVTSAVTAHSKIGLQSTPRSHRVQRDYVADLEASERVGEKEAIDTGLKLGFMEAAVDLNSCFQLVD